MSKGMAFLAKYRTFRAGSQSEGEIDYNFGRAFHQLGTLVFRATLILNVHGRVDYRGVGTIQTSP